MKEANYRNFSIMASLLISTLIVLFSSVPAMSLIASMTRVQTYIVHLNHPDDTSFSGPEDLESWYKSFLPKTTESSNGPSSRLVYSYHNVVTGFAAKLSAKEAKAMEQISGFISARPQRIFQLHTTHSPNFLGLHMGVGAWNGSNYGKGVIIGLLDTGITPNHPSFSGEGMLPPPAKWKGKCEFNGTACNNKLIGARNFLKGSADPPADDEGHGTHTASTAGGNFVKGANVDGQASGTAVGMAPMAHVAMYKVCSESGCSEADILAAMDAAVEDGVDILSLSLGGASFPFYEDGIAIGAFGAVKKGVFVSCSAGNSGPESNTVSNEAPWILTVGASTLDRTIKATALLGNNASYDGESLYQPTNFPAKLLPLFYSPDTASCGEGSFDGVDVKGKIVVCERGNGIARIQKGQTVKDAGGAAMILTNQITDAYSTLADPHVLPAAHVSYAAGEMIKHYINSTADATATIVFKGTSIGDTSAPVVTSFSSRGPSNASPGILKPDIIGPGVSILAAWPVSVSNATTNSTANFNVISGTSMSCPHLSGIAALVKSAHPDWSPAAIKSAIMTSANQMNLAHTPIQNEKHEKADFFAIGAGHVNPSKALNPGLIYDLQPKDYVPYLCGLDYTDDEVTFITGSKVNCSSITPIKEAELNYPSFSITLGTSNKTYTRTVTNVGDANSSYFFSPILPPGVGVASNPHKLDFTEVNQKLKYEVTFSLSGVDTGGGEYVQGSLAWVSIASKHVVRSPISVKLE